MITNSIINYIFLMFTGEARYSVTKLYAQVQTAALQIIIINTSDCLAPDCLHFAIPVRDVSFFLNISFVKKTFNPLVNGS